MNKVVLIGRVCAKPDAFTTQNGISRSSFRLAVNRPYKNPQGNYDADFLPIIAWRQTADSCNKYLDKGRQVAVEGSIQTRSYDAQDGSKRYVTEIVADSVEGLGSPNNEQGHTEASSAPPQRNDQQRMDMSGFTEVDDEKLPWEE